MQVEKYIGTDLGCYKCFEDIRFVEIALLAAGGLSLIFQWGAKIGIVAEFLWLCTQNNLLIQKELPDLRSFLLNILVLIVLLK